MYRRLDAYGPVAAPKWLPYRQVVCQYEDCGGLYHLRTDFDEGLTGMKLDICRACEHFKFVSNIHFQAFDGSIILMTMDNESSVIVWIHSIVIVVVE